eukprot:TRINITY_DN70882_c1_g1_i1.p1 TRINITY_DN70882_c1_g1~~TRINITY_DN70882_c1_g1_i1.p1  ORF type:complete len:380 (-),score=33.74 TRINITY_DN70882_c1_g1_i1:86-1225(-)
MASTSSHCKTYSFSCAPTKVLLCAISSQHAKVAIIFANGFLRVCSVQNLADTLILQKDLMAIASLKIPAPSTIEDIAWSLENTSADSEFLSILSNGGMITLYSHKVGYNLAFFAGIHPTKIVDAFCWNKGDLSFVCCYQDGSLACQRINTLGKNVETLYTIDLRLVLDEVCLRLHCPLPNTLIWEGTQGSMVLFDLHQKVLKAVSGDFAAIPLALSGKFNDSLREENEFYCEKNWVKPETRCGTLAGISQLNGILVCPNYFSMLESSEELITIPLAEFTYKLTQDQLQFLQSSGKVGRIRAKNHVEVVEWSPFVETQEYFVTYDVADQLLVWKYDKGKAGVVQEMEVNGVGMILWIDADKILVVQRQQMLSIIKLDINY